MEVLAVVGSSLMSAGGTAAAGLSSLASTVGTGTLLQGGATALSMLATIAGGKAQQGAAELAAKDELLKGRATALQLREELAGFIGQTSAAAAASGIDTTSGTIAAIASKAQRDTKFNVQQTILSSRIASLMGIVRGANASAAANADALVQGLKFAGDAYSRKGLSDLAEPKPGGGTLGHI